MVITPKRQVVCVRHTTDDTFGETEASRKLRITREKFRTIYKAYARQELRRLWFT